MEQVRAKGTKSLRKDNLSVDTILAAPLECLLKCYVLGAHF